MTLRRNKTGVTVLGALLALAAGAALAVAQETAPAAPAPGAGQGEYSTEGYFATLMVDQMKTNVRQTWTGENAIQSLTNLGIEPLDGWDANAVLTEGTMVFLLRFIDIPIYTENPEREVSILEARSIIKKFERHFVTNVEVFRLNDNTTATTVDEWSLEHPSG